MISTGIVNNRGVNESLDRISGGGQSSQPLKSAGMFGRLGEQISALFTAILPRIGETGLPSPFQGNPSAPAGGTQTAKAPEKAPEAGSGTTVTVGDDPRKKAFTALRAAGFDVKMEDVTEEMAKRYQKGEIKLAEMEKEIEKAGKKEEATAKKAEPLKKKDAEPVRDRTDSTVYT